MMDIPIISMDKAEESEVNTLRYRPGKCVNCGRCTQVCPHGVFEAGERKVRMASPNRCMECGACQVNCPTGAISVNSGVGCASALIKAALTGSKEETCGPDCCGP
jgi:NAD-dependent dihydropyrimidine dehydrogenase PreA subunit